MLTTADQKTGLYPFYPRLLSQHSVKYLSKDLQRLSATPFHLLKRRRVKRQVKTRNGKTCFRGYKYIYTITNWGRKYLTYLVTGGETQSENKDFRDLTLRAIIEKNAPPEQKEILKAYFLRGTSTKPGVSERFRSHRNDRIIQVFAEYEKERRRENLKTRVGKILDALQKIGSSSKLDSDNVVIPIATFTDGLREAISEIQSLIG
jgi:hypothetical protein